MNDYPALSELSDKDLISLLGLYLKNPQFIKEDQTFIDSIKAELKQRSAARRLELNESPR